MGNREACEQGAGGHKISDFRSRDPSAEQSGRELLAAKRVLEVRVLNAGQS
jgi:hypothetical protein